MTILEFFFIALAFLLVGGLEQIAERCRNLLDMLRPPRDPYYVPRETTHRGIHQPLKPGEREPEMPAGERPFPPVPPPGMFEQANPDHREYERDRDLGGIETAIPPHMLPGDEKPD